MYRTLTIAGLRERVLAGERLAEDQRVHLVRALVGEDRLEVRRVAHDRVLRADPVGAEDRARLAGDRDRLADVVQLADADVLGRDAPLVLEPPDLQREQLRLLEL